MDNIGEITNAANAAAEIKDVYRMIAVPNKVVFPAQTVQLDLNTRKSVSALNKAIENNQNVFFVMQKHSNSDNPAPKDIHRVGTVSRIKQIIKLSDDSVKVVAVGVERMEIENYVAITPCFEVNLKPFERADVDPMMLAAAKRSLLEIIDEYKTNNGKALSEVIKEIKTDDLDFVIANLSTLFKDENERQKLLCETDDVARLETIMTKLLSEIDLVELQRSITEKVRKRIEKDQRSYFLREQQKVITKELNDGDDDAQIFKKKLDELKLAPEITEKVSKEIARLEKMGPFTPETSVIRNYVETVLELPWNTRSDADIDIKNAARILDEDHYGLEKVKERILEYLAVYKLTHKLKSPVLCFVGPPGVGKTSIVSSIARASDRKLVTMSLGGVRDEAEIRGHRRTYIGALPGRIINGLRQAGTKNPVFLLDEIDKTGHDFRGDPANALLEVLDPNTNREFKDHFLELPFDLSEVMFITTANTTESIPAPLIDRMEIIELSGYTYEEKFEIARRYLVPKQRQANGLSEDNISISDDAIKNIIEKYTRESGVRNLEREIGAVCRKVAVKLVESKAKDFSMQVNELTEYLGAPKYTAKVKNESDEVGLATGLAWTGAGGKCISIEVAVVGGGKGEIKLTGSLGDVMKESCHTALTLVRSRADKYDIDRALFSECDVHIHVPEGATPKDGPSAGITIACAVLSAFSKKAVTRDAAMTGEVTLLGNVLAIGGLKEKSLAALRAGVSKLILPSENKKDIDEIPASVKNSMEIVFVESIDEVFNQVIR